MLQEINWEYKVTKVNIFKDEQQHYCYAGSLIHRLAYCEPIHVGVVLSEISAAKG